MAASNEHIGENKGLAENRQDKCPKLKWGVQNVFNGVQTMFHRV